MKKRNWDFASVIPTLRDLGAGLRRAVGDPNVGHIGLELGRDHLYMVQLEKSPAGLKIRAAVALACGEGRDQLLKSPNSLRIHVRKALKAGPFAGRRVVTCLPPEQLKIMLLNYRLSEQDDEQQIIMGLAMERVAGNPEDWVVDYTPLRDRDDMDGERVAMAAMVRRDQQFAFLESLRHAGLEVEAVEVGPLAIRRLVAAMDTEKVHPNVLVINFGREKTYLTVVSGRRLTLDREVDFGEGRLIAHLSESLDSTPELVGRVLSDYGILGAPALTVNETVGISVQEVQEALVEILTPAFRDLSEQVRTVLTYTAAQTHGASVDRIYLRGCVAGWPGVEDFLSRLLNQNVSVLDPFAPFGDLNDGALERGLNPSSGIALAAGCALRGVISGV